MDAAKRLVEELAGKAGFAVDAAAVLELAERLTAYGAELLAAQAWRAAAAKGSEAAANLTTADQAEEFQRR